MENNKNNFERFISYAESEFNLKFVADNFSYQITCGILAAAALYVIKHGSNSLLFPYSELLTGSLLLIASVLLFALSGAQLVLVSVKKLNSKVAAGVLATLIFFPLLDFFWFAVHRFIIN